MGGAALLAAGCIKPNPDFVEDTEGVGSVSGSPSSSAAGSSTTDPTMTTDASVTSNTTAGTDTATTCDMAITQELTPIDLDEIMEGDVGSAEGNFTPDVRESWYRFPASADFTLATLFASVATPGSESAAICAFFECAGSLGSMAFITCTEGTLSNSGGGLQGCCNAGQVSVQWTCLDAQPEGNVYLQTRAPASLDACAPFELAFSLSGLN